MNRLTLKIVCFTTVFLLVFSFLAYKTTVINAVKADVTDIHVDVTPQTPGSVAEYKIKMEIHSSLYAGHNVFIQFPEDCTLPSSINSANITINTVNGQTQPDSVVVESSNTVKIELSDVVQIRDPDFYIDFSTNAGIKNPSQSSVYDLYVWTDREPVHIAGSFIISSNGGSGNKVTGLQVLSVIPSAAGKVAEYTILFHTSMSGALLYDDGDYVDIYFPEGTGMPRNPDKSAVLMNNYEVSNVQVEGTRVRVYLPGNAIQQIGYGVEVDIIFTEDFGIKNPEVPGNYVVQVSTSKDTGVAISNPYSIFGTPVSNLSVSVSPTAQFAIANYKISFKTGTTDGTLKRGVDKINIVFPKDVTFPSNIIPGAVDINNAPCVNVSIDGQKLIVTTPVDISANSSVTVDITKNFGIKNPAHTGEYKIKVYTSANASPLEVSFTITSSLVSNVNVVLSNTSSAAVSAYTISFQTSTSGALTGGVDKINVIFPIGTTVPATIPNSAVTVNNIPTTDVAVSGTTVTATVPTSIPANSTVSVVFSEKANIKNPVLGGSYRLLVSTTKENTPVESAPYTISVVPQAKITIMPSKPDGLNGYYKTQPTISFTVTSSVDPNPYIYYYFDGNAPVLYNGTTIKVPEGNHILYYYAVDHQNHKQETQSVIFKVDTILPQLVITSPKNNAILNNKTFEVKGTVDIGSTVKIDGKPVTVSSSGSFTAQVTINGDSAVITVVAEDLAGNTTTKTIAVSLDTTPPALTVTTPVPFEEIHKLPVVVQGKTEKDATVTVNGNAATVNENGTFSYALSSLPEGAISVITVIAKDPAGNETKKMINVKYIKTTIMKLQIGNKVALVNTSAETLDAPPVIIKNRTFVPLRFISEAFGAKLTWDPVFQLIDISLGSDSLRLQIGKGFAEVNGKKVLFDAAPVIVKGRTMVPIRFISEALDAQVLWDDTTKTVTIVYPKPSQP